MDDDKMTVTPQAQEEASTQEASVEDVSGEAVSEADTKPKTEKVQVVVMTIDALNVLISKAAPNITLAEYEELRRSMQVEEREVVKEDRDESGE